MHIYVRGVTFLCYHSFPVAHPPPSGVMPLHTPPAHTNTILSSENQILSSSQKELLLWHKRLSHANLAWIQNLMQDCKWLNDSMMASSLHTGPFISSSSQAPTCDVQGLKCSACLCAKAAT
jgi:hypothetical protein